MVLISLAILITGIGSTTAVLLFAYRWQSQWLAQRILHEKQLAVYEEITALIGTIKATLDYSSGDETLGEWRSALMSPVREMLAKSYEWGVFLPDDLRELPTQYAGKLARGLNKLNNNTPHDIESFAALIEELKHIENDAANELQERLRDAVGVNWQRRTITLRR